MLAIGASPARADVRISGTEARVTIEAQDAALSDVIAQLTAMYGVTFQSSTPLDRAVSGRYSGSLRKVIGRLLENNNYVTRQIDGRLAIVVYGSSKLPVNSDQSPVPRAAQPGAAPAAPAPARRMLANPAGAMDSGYMR